MQTSMPRIIWMAFSKGSQRLSLTDATAALACFINESIGSVIRMPSRAHRFLSVMRCKSVSPKKILASGDNLHVGRITTGTIPTEMVNDQSVRNLTIRQGPSNSVGIIKDVFTTTSAIKSSVSIAPKEMRPGPATLLPVASVHLRPKAVGQWGTRISMSRENVCCHGSDFTTTLTECQV